MKKFLTYIMDIGEHMLRAGAEVHRVEDSVKRMALSLGASRVDVFIITSSMVVTVFVDEGNPITQTRRITSSSTDYEKIHRLNDLSRKICEKKPSADEIEADLAAAISCKSYPFPLEMICYALIAGAFTVFFGGNAADAAVSFVIGALLRLVVHFSEKIMSNKIFSKFFSSFTATLFAFAALSLGLIEGVDKVMIGNIMLLIPGIGLTNAIRDLFTGDSIAGLFRSIEAALTALAIAAGYFAVVFLGGAL